MIEIIIPFYTNYLGQWSRYTMLDAVYTYNCAEQYMMAQKALIFKDQETFAKIISTLSPAQQKDLGRQVKNFDVDKWNLVARDIVYNGNYLKFSQNKRLLEKLADTKPMRPTHDSILVEASPTDLIWGVGLAETDPLIFDRKNWRGTNWLGEVLTTLRDDFILGKANLIDIIESLKGNPRFK